MSAYIIKYGPALSEVVYRPLKVVIGVLKKAHIFALRTLKIIKQCHELLLVLGSDLVQTHSYSRRMAGSLNRAVWPWCWVQRTY